jgi:hypothetical protein
MTLPNRRQVIPIVASSQDGSEERVIEMVVERDTEEVSRTIRESGTANG